GGARAPGPPGIARPARDWHCVAPTLMRRLPATLTLAAGLLVLPAAAAARSAGDPIRLVWDEGDVAGTSTIYGPAGGEPGGHIAGSWGRGARRRTLDERVALPKGTYWGPLIFIVLKNFDANAEDGRLVFRTVAPTPRPRALDLELARGPSTVLERTGARLATRRFELGPTVHWTVDPLLRLVLPRPPFRMLPG